MEGLVMVSDYPNIRLSGGGYQKIRVSGFFWYSGILIPLICNLKCMVNYGTDASAEGDLPLYQRVY
jgi:hypothetical protein